MPKLKKEILVTVYRLEANFQITFLYENFYVIETDDHKPLLFLLGTKCLANKSKRIMLVPKNEA